MNEAMLEELVSKPLGNESLTSLPEHLSVFQPAVKIFGRQKIYLQVVENILKHLVQRYVCHRFF